MSDGHQWCNTDEMHIGESGTNHQQQWCVKCGTTRVLFGLGWAYQIPDLAREKPCDESVNATFLSKPPERSYSNRAGKKVLGRGLKELMAGQVQPSVLKDLLEKKDEGS